VSLVSRVWLVALSHTWGYGHPESRKMVSFLQGVYDVSDDLTTRTSSGARTPRSSCSSTPPSPRPSRAASRTARSPPPT